MTRTKMLPLLAVVLLAPACTGDSDSADSTDGAATTESTGAATTSPPNTAADTTTTVKRPGATTTTTTPRRAVAKPVVLRTVCAKRTMAAARLHTEAADREATAAEWRSMMARKNNASAERNPKQAKTHHAAARRHAAAARAHEASARSEGAAAKRVERRALALNTVAACQAYLATLPLPRMPLTGELLGKNRKLPERPALVVKIDNHVQARPQYGLNSADIVFEEIVEYGTRFAAVFHSRSANPVGPIRSGRTQDINMLGRLHHPLFAWSGGNANVTNAINASELVNIGPSVAPAYYRYDRGVDFEHTLFSNTDTLWSFTPPGWQQPGPYFHYLRPNESFGGDKAAGVDLQMDAYSVRWAWTPERRGYLRYNSGAPHNANDGQIIANNIVILDMQYRPSPADARSPEAQTVGTGRAWVYADGRVRAGTWERKSAHAPFELIGRAGKVIELKPGRTWVELAEVGADGQPTPIPAP